MEDLESLGYLIRDAREAKKLKQAELGAMVGLSRASISLLERGNIKNPRPALLQAFASILEIPVGSLYEKAGITLPDGDAGEAQWLLEELDRPNRRRLIAIGFALLQEQRNQPQREARSAARP